jgi:hypothetical protein
MVIAVGMDVEYSEDMHGDIRLRIYRAMTRAHMLAFIVNVHVSRGWLEFLGLVTFDKDARFDEKVELEKFDDTAASRFAKDMRHREAALEYHSEAEEDEYDEAYVVDGKVVAGAMLPDNTGTGAADGQKMEKEEDSIAGEDIPRVISAVWDTSGITVRLSVEKPLYVPLAAPAKVSFFFGVCASSFLLSLYICGIYVCMCVRSINKPEGR